MKQTAGGKIPEGVYYRGRFRSTLPWSRIGGGKAKLGVRSISIKELLGAGGEGDQIAFEYSIHTKKG